MFASLFALVVAAVGCAGAVFEAKDVGAGCEGLEATCSTDGESILVCDGDVMVVEDACADGCVGASNSWFSTEPEVACCDNGGDRQCININDSSAREDFQFDDEGGLITE